MKPRVVFDCDFCNNSFSRQMDCETHEASHFGLTRKEYLDWQILNKSAAKEGYVCGVDNNPMTRATFDEAIEALCAFEKKHGLEGYEKKPSNFYI